MWTISFWNRNYFVIFLSNRKNTFYHLNPWKIAILSWEHLVSFWCSSSMANNSATEILSFCKYFSQWQHSLVMWLLRCIVLLLFERYAEGQNLCCVFVCPFAGMPERDQMVSWQYWLLRCIGIGWTVSRRAKFTLCCRAPVCRNTRRKQNGLDLPYENIITLALMCWALIVAKVYVCKRLCINLYKTILWISTFNLRFCTPNYYHQ